jgi:hypothetical protein
MGGEMKTLKILLMLLLASPVYAQLSPYSQSIIGIFTFATLPSAVNYNGFTAYTSDDGPVYSNGVSWVIIGSGGGGGGSGNSTIFTLVSTNVTLSPTSTSVLVDASSGPVTITLPTAVGDTNIYVIKKKDSSANTVTVNTTSAQTLDAASTQVIGIQNTSISCKSDNTNWWIF